VFVEETGIEHSFVQMTEIRFGADCVACERGRGFELERFGVLDELYSQSVPITIPPLLLGRLESSSETLLVEKYKMLMNLHHYSSLLHCQLVDQTS
jgi:hypothetical protein